LTPFGYTFQYRLDLDVFISLVTQSFPALTYSWAIYPEKVAYHSIVEVCELVQGGHDYISRYASDCSSVQNCAGLFHRYGPIENRISKNTVLSASSLKKDNQPLNTDHNTDHNTIAVF